MSTHKHFDKICCVVMALVILLTVFFVNGEKFGLKMASKAMGYESRIFDKNTVHTIDIVMDDWDSFLETCTNEEYTSCSVVIDGEAYKNVALRAKGNTSLTNVKNYGNNRYSLKIEFDAYDSNKTYYGLDKLCLNNIIQDNTFMKDYITYTMMDSFGVASPLCSFVYVTVNGEDWGLFLAVEGVEDSFLQRNYGNEDGDLYKPDSQSMGGGRGNGKGFDMDEFNGENSQQTEEKTTEKATENQTSTETKIEVTKASAPPQTGAQNGVPPQGGAGGTPPGGFGGQPPEMPNGEPPQMPNGEMPQMPDGETPQMPDSKTDENSAEKTDVKMQEKSDEKSGEKDAETSTEKQENSTQKTDEKNDKFGGGFSMKSDDVSLIYSDDNFDSYSNIFNNAKTKVTDKDKTRLIASLKNINEQKNLDTSVDIESVIRYFVVHNFVLNFDSYTGSMIHNYYLYENDGKLSMIPWDYNLAFGGFMSMGGADSLVNYPIDSPVSEGTVDSRPMLSWILNSEEYTEEYHKLFSEFLKEFFDNNSLSKEIKRVAEMISPYVEKDPTKFCTFEEFQKGAETLEKFCTLRAESISKQLDGTIGSTSEAQTNRENFVSANGITISDMGSMGNMGGGKGGDKNNSVQPQENANSEQKNQSETNGETPPEPPENDGNAQPQPPQNNGEQQGKMNGETPPEPPENDGNAQPQPPQNNGEQQGEMNGEIPPEPPENDGNNQPQPPDGNGAPQQTAVTKDSIIIASASVALLLGIILFALFYKRRK
ncbi:MAG: CotH kinase family protein [Clostridia bacterium]|nr:CotH kinase family protein [Clostridia bacterium]